MPVVTAQNVSSSPALSSDKLGFRVYEKPRRSAPVSVTSPVQHPAPVNHSPVMISEARPVTEISATNKRRAPLVAENDLQVFASDDEIKTLAGGGNLRIHKHGSGKYRGAYLCLRPAGSRTDKRPMLASGRPAKLKAYLAGLGIRICTRHRSVAPCAGCRKARKEAR